MYQSKRPAKESIALAASVLAAVAVMCIWLLPNDPNIELAAATRHAIESADRARRESDAAHLAPARWRLLAIAVGTAVPLAVATIALTIVTRSRPADVDVLLAMAELQTSLPPCPPGLNGSSKRRLAVTRRIGGRSQ